MHSGIFFLDTVRRAGPPGILVRYGMDEGFVRHVSRYVLINIIKVFVELYFDQEAFTRFKSYLRELGIPDQSVQPHAIVGVPWDRRR